MELEQARNELKQIRVFYNRISERKERLAEIRQSMTSIRVCAFGGLPAHGATPQDSDRLEKAIDRCSLIEELISEDILEMAEAQQALIEKIECLPEPYAEVLTRRYIHMQRFERIAVDMDYSYDRIRHLNSLGVKKYAELKVDTK